MRVFTKPEPLPSLSLLRYSSSLSSSSSSISFLISSMFENALKIDLQSPPEMQFKRSAILDPIVASSLLPKEEKVLYWYFLIISNVDIYKNKQIPHIRDGLYRKTDLDRILRKAPFESSTQVDTSRFVLPIFFNIAAPKSNQLSTSLIKLLNQSHINHGRP